MSVRKVCTEVFFFFFMVLKFSGGLNKCFQPFWEISITKAIFFCKAPKSPYDCGNLIRLCRIKHHLMGDVGSAGGLLGYL